MMVQFNLYVLMHLKSIQSILPKHFHYRKRAYIQKKFNQMLSNWATHALLHIGKRGMLFFIFISRSVSNDEKFATIGHTSSSSCCNVAIRVYEKVCHRRFTRIRKSFVRVSRMISKKIVRPQVRWIVVNFAIRVKDVPLGIDEKIVKERKIAVVRKYVQF